MVKIKVHDEHRGGVPEYHTKSQENSMHTGVSPKIKKISKSVPKGIEPAYPQKNFVKAWYDNRGDKDGFFEYMYGESRSLYADNPESKRKSSNFGHGIGQRAGKLRLSGKSNAHRIGKR